MKKKIINHRKQRNKSRKYINFYFLLNVMLFFPFFSQPKKQSRILTIYNSEIYLTINGNGLQNLLSNDFYTNPSDVIIKVVSKKDVCSKTC